MCASRCFAAWATLLVAVVVAAPVVAGEKKADSAARGEARRLQQMQRKFDQEKAQLAQEKEALAGELDGVRRRAAEASQRLAAVAGERTALRTERETLRETLAGRERELAQVRSQLAAAQAAESGVRSALQTEKAALAACGERNAALHAIGVEAIACFAGSDCTGPVSPLEPFTGLHGVRVENHAESLRERLDEQRYLNTPVARR